MRGVLFHIWSFPDSWTCSSFCLPILLLLEFAGFPKYVTVIDSLLQRSVNNDQALQGGQLPYAHGPVPSDQMLKLKQVAEVSKSRRYSVGSIATPEFKTENTGCPARMHVERNQACCCQLEIELQALEAVSVSNGSNDKRLTNDLYPQSCPPRSLS
jgi:hypothetical protein